VKVQLSHKKNDSYKVNIDRVQSKYKWSVMVRFLYHAYNNAAFPLYIITCTSRQKLIFGTRQAICFVLVNVVELG